MPKNWLVLKLFIGFEANLNQCVDIVVVQVTKNYFNAGPNYIVFQQGDASLVTHFAIPWKAHTVVPTSLAQRSFAAERRRTPELKVTKIRSIIALSTNMVIVLEAPAAAE